MTPKLSALRLYDRDQWRDLVLVALARCRTVQDAASELGISWRTLMRWKHEIDATWPDDGLPAEADEVVVLPSGVLRG